MLVEGTGGVESATFSVDARPAFLATTFFAGVFLLPACGPFFDADVDLFAVALLPADFFADVADAFLAEPFFADAFVVVFFAAAFFAVTAFGVLSLPSAAVNAAPSIRNVTIFSHQQASSAPCHDRSTLRRFLGHDISRVEVRERNCLQV
ncbi:membrane protein [Caballeronia zhejiangensis]|uniref:Membrane protein n=1 Tax=Caballeronia zhejiangensis TaxID=871203 RepID=A0A656QBG5_9BURK|nr:membrane protein [Caballeronia zhejiangensis]